jgi:hypothetical protein
MGGHPFKASSALKSRSLAKELEVDRISMLSGGLAQVSVESPS